MVTPLFVHADGASAVVDGGVVSMRTGSVVVCCVLSARSVIEADDVRASPSPVIVVSPGQAPLMPLRSSLHVHWIVTSPRYQPAMSGAVVGAPVRVGLTVST